MSIWKKIKASALKNEQIYFVKVCFILSLTLQHFHLWSLLGISFLRENLWKLENENEEHTTAGFEVVFPSLLEIAHGLDIEIPYDSHVLQKVYAMRNFKLKKYIDSKLTLHVCDF